MKVKLTLVLLLLGITTWTSAQTELSKAEKDAIVDAVSQRMALEKRSQKYFHLGFVKHKLETEDGLFSMDSKFGAHLTSGKTYYLHGTPILGLIKIGLDWTYFDLNYTQFESDPMLVEDEEGGWEEDKLTVYKAEAGMHFGPSITVFPVKNLKAKAFFRYAPAYSAMYDNQNEEFGSGFGSYFVSGVSVNYGGIGVGIEQRWGSAKHKVSGLEWSEDGLAIESVKEKFKLKGPRFFVSFAF